MVGCFHETCTRDAGQAARARAKQSRVPSCACPRQAEPRAWLRAHVRLSRARPRRFFRLAARARPTARRCPSAAIAAAPSRPLPASVERDDPERDDREIRGKFVFSEGFCYFLFVLIRM